MYDNFRRVMSVDRNYASITVVIMAVIVYGSLYPFAFGANDTPGGAWRALLATWNGPSGRYDVIANVLFYLPLGFFGVRSTGLRSVAARVALVLAAGTALSISMELLQFYDAGRVSAMSDVYANVAGILFGAMAGTILAVRFPVQRLRFLGRRPFVFVLLMGWLGSRLFPYVPAIHLHKYWTALQPLVVAPAFPPLDVFRHLARWLAVAVLLEELSDSGFGRLGYRCCSARRLNCQGRDRRNSALSGRGGRRLPRSADLERRSLAAASSSVDRAVVVCRVGCADRSGAFSIRANRTELSMDSICVADGGFVLYRGALLFGEGVHRRHPGLVDGARGSALDGGAHIERDSDHGAQPRADAAARTRGRPHRHASADPGRSRDAVDRRDRRSLCGSPKSVNAHRRRDAHRHCARIS